VDSIRQPAVDGSFYPSDPNVLRRTVEDLVQKAVVPATRVEPRLLIVPHAGYVYSGPVAATAYRLLQSGKSPARLVAVGPSHFVEFAGLATPGSEKLATPLGVIPVDEGLLAVAGEHPDVAPGRTAHAREHSLEVQLPFLQVVLESFALLPLLTGAVEPATVADVLGSVMKAEGVFGIISSDLSHYLDYDTARARDRLTAAAIIEQRAAQLSWGDACGLIGIQAALLLSQREGWECEQLDLRSSGDTAGDRERVVGYGSFVIGPSR
jgi:AmmeMemoRadiSam system protein B